MMASSDVNDSVILRCALLRASKDARPGPVILRGSLRSHLRMTDEILSHDAGF